MGSIQDGRPDQVVKSLSSLDKSSFSSDVDRRLAIVQVQKLLMRLQTPDEYTHEVLHTTTFVMTAVKSLLELDLFNKWEQDGAGRKSAQQLAKLTGSQIALLERLLRVLVTSDLLSAEEDGTTGEVHYIFTDYARGLASGSWDTTGTGILSEPTSSEASPWASHMGGPFIDYVKTTPDLVTHMNYTMASKCKTMIPWFTFYPAEQLLGRSEHPVLVDIGGGSGFDIRQFERHFGSRLAPGQLVLQEMPQVIAGLEDLPATIHKRAYDFFTEQPVKGARAYFMHSVLHDWSAEECKKILARVKAAMTPGFSRLLINENVLSLHATPLACSTDLTMMVLNSGAERTETQWRELLAASGLRVTNIYSAVGVDEGIIEAEI